MELYPCYMYFEQIIIVYTDKNYRTKRNTSMINATSKWKTISRKSNKFAKGVAWDNLFTSL